MKKNTIILGSGLAGLSTAWNLLNNGKMVRDEDRKIFILEKENEIGGMSRTFETEGYYFDYGPHNFHTVHNDILDFLKKNLGENLKRHYPTVKLFINQKYVDYPLKGFAALNALPNLKKIPAILSFLLARFKMLVNKPEKDDSFADWIKNRFGNVLYSIYFGPYAEKTWKINPKDLSNYVAIKRIPVLSISDYFSRLIFNKNRQYHSEDPSIVESYYPKKGAGEIVKFFYNDIIKLGGNFKKNIKIISIEGKDKKIEKIIYLINGKEKELQIDFIFNTIPINNFIKFLKMNIPEKIRVAADNLDYCAEHLLFLKINKLKVLKSTLTYFSSPKINFTRIYNVKSYSQECIPKNKTGLCVEFTCNIGDEIWNSKPEELYHYLIEIFEKYNILNRNDVDGYFTQKISHAYPRFRKGFKENVNIILSYLSTLENVVTIGRQGLFTYANMDDVIKMGFQASYMPIEMKKKIIDYKELFPKYVYF